jgi:hypothetical protein
LRKRWQLRCLFYPRKRLAYVIPQRSVLTLGDCCALRRLSGSLLGVVLSRRVASDFHDFASNMFCNAISAFHWGLARYASIRRFRNAGNEL